MAAFTVWNVDAPDGRGWHPCGARDWAWPQVLDACHLTDAAPRCDHAVAMRTLPPRVVVFPMMSSSQACRATHRPLGPSSSG